MCLCCGCRGGRRIFDEKKGLREEKRENRRAASFRNKSIEEEGGGQEAT